MSSPQWTPAHFKQNGWSAGRALAVARRLDPDASEEHFLRTSVTNPDKKVADKNVLKKLFMAKKIPLEYSLFSANLASFIDDGDVTGTLHRSATRSLVLPALSYCLRCNVRFVGTAPKTLFSLVRQVFYILCDRVYYPRCRHGRASSQMMSRAMRTLDQPLSLPLKPRCGK
jgi:hypothetical protein